MAPGDKLAKSQERQNDINKLLEKIQSTETILVDTLKNTPNLSTDEVKSITNALDELGDSRVLAEKGLTDNLDIITDSMIKTHNNLVNQLTTTEMANQEVAAGKKDLNALLAAKNKHQRMTQINTYYGKYYQAHTYTMKLIIYATLPILLFSILKSKNILPAGIAKILNIIIIAIFAILMMLHLGDINKRDNMVYSEYDFGSPSDSDDIENSNNSSLYPSDGEVCEEDLINDLNDIMNNDEDVSNDVSNDTSIESEILASDSIGKPPSSGETPYNKPCLITCNECYARDYDDCDDRYVSNNCEKCCPADGMTYDATDNKCICDDNKTFNKDINKCENFQGMDIVRENFQNSRIPLSVAYVASPTPSCPFRNNSNVKPFSSNANYATV
tara:strand:- start:129 stop:1289 length:1161 start_codon:yes stop_codon:yes gene_type:complete